jgi:hypothetical protein
VTEDGCVAGQGRRLPDLLRDANTADWLLFGWGTFFGFVLGTFVGWLWL